MVLRDLTIDHTILSYDNHEENDFWKHYRKGENPGDQHFLLFPQCFQKAFLKFVESRDCMVKSAAVTIIH